MAAVPGPNLLLLALFTGVALGSVEFLRPGWILPGVAGATLVMLAIAGLCEYPLDIFAIALLGCSILLAAADAYMRWGGWVACLAAVMGCLAIHRLPFQDTPPIHWGTAVLGGGVLLFVWRLLVFAVQAKTNKVQ